MTATLIMSFRFRHSWERRHLAGTFLAVPTSNAGKMPALPGKPKSKSFPLTPALAMNRPKSECPKSERNPKSEHRVFVVLVVEVQGCNARTRWGNSLTEERENDLAIFDQGEERSD